MRFNRITILSLLILATISCRESAKKENTNVTNVPVLVQERADLAPIMLDDIHYYTLDREAVNVYFEEHFGTRAMLEDSPNPFEFIDFQLVRSEQSTINISGSGPFPGIKVGDPKRWERKLVKPSPENPHRYGVHWLGMGTKNLTLAKNQLKSEGVQILEENFKLPHIDQPSLLCYGPDYNLLVVTEITADKAVTPYFIDHLLLLVKDLKANVKFFEDVFQGKIQKRNKDWVQMKIANQNFVLATPEALNLDRTGILDRDPTVFQPNIDHLGFLYKSITPAYENAVAKGYEFLSPPIKIKYYDKPTLYTFGITYSPDGLQCELFEEEGRTSSRKQFKNRVKQ